MPLPIVIRAMVDFEYTLDGPAYCPKGRGLNVTALLLVAAEGRGAAVYVLLRFSDIDRQADSGVTALFIVSTMAKSTQLGCFLGKELRHKHVNLTRFTLQPGVGVAT